MLQASRVVATEMHTPPVRTLEAVLRQSGSLMVPENLISLQLNYAGRTMANENRLGLPCWHQVWPWQYLCLQD